MRYLGIDLAAVPDPARVVRSTFAALSLCIFRDHLREGRWVKSAPPAARACRGLADDSAAQLVRWAMEPFLARGPSAPKPLKRLDPAL